MDMDMWNKGREEKGRGKRKLGSKFSNFGAYDCDDGYYTVNHKNVTFYF